MFHRYVLYEERSLGNVLSGFDLKNQRVLINRRKSSIFTPQNIGNPEEYKMKFQKKGGIRFFYKEVFQMHLGSLPVC